MKVGQLDPARRLFFITFGRASLNIPGVAGLFERDLDHVWSGLPGILDDKFLLIRSKLLDLAPILVAYSQLAR